jgi:hypothetical protein
VTRRRTVTVLAVLVIAAVAALAIRARADGPLRCPAGTRRVEARPPAGLEEWCERSSPAGGGVREGPYRARYPGGRLKAEGGFAAGRKTGPWTYWYGNGLAGGRGQAREAGEYDDGMERGRWTRWYAGGSVREAGDYRGGRRHGRWAFWSEIGIKEREGEYRDGQPVGVWQRWTPQGVACPPEPLGPGVLPSDERAGVSS